MHATDCYNNLYSSITLYRPDGPVAPHKHPTPPANTYTHPTTALMTPSDGKRHAGHQRAKVSIQAPRP